MLLAWAAEEKSRAMERYFKEREAAEQHLVAMRKMIEKEFGK